MAEQSPVSEPRSTADAPPAPAPSPDAGPARPTLRERQAPLKERYAADPASAALTITVRSVTEGDAPTRCAVAARPGGDGDEVVWPVGAHPFAGGEGDLACSGDLLLASLAACQEITVRMVAAAMGIALDAVAVEVRGEMDFRGTMGLDPTVPVGFRRVATDVRIAADAPADRLERLARRAEQFCVVAATLRQPPELTTTITAESVAR